MKTTGFPEIDALYRIRKGSIDIVDVPELGVARVDGFGAPDGDSFAAAVTALYAVSYGAHFARKKLFGDAPSVMVLEALWWVEGDRAQSVMEQIGAGRADMSDSDRSDWRWRAMIVQLPPLGAPAIHEAVDAARAKGKAEAATLDTVTFERWTEGPSAQILHVGPYSTEQRSVVVLHAAIAERGLRPRGRHHEIYLGDPRRAAPDELRTILRQPVEPTT